MSRMNATEFVSIVNHVMGEGAHATINQGTIAKTLGVSRSTVSHAVVAFNKGEGEGKILSNKISNMVRGVYDAFLENGSLPETNSEDDGMRPFVEVPMARCRESGRIYTMDKVTAGLVGNIGGKIETDEEIAARIGKRFSIMDRMVRGVIEGFIPSMVVFGAPGIGKSWGIDKALKEAAADRGLEYDVIKGGCTAPGLYMALYKMRNGGVVNLDDCDGIFRDEDALNVLKSALDSTGERIVSWRKQSSWVFDPDLLSDEQQEKALEKGEVPNRFEFKGSVVFVTNTDFAAKVAEDSRMSPHFDALMSRSLYLDLTLKTIRDRLIRIRQVFLGWNYESEDGPMYQMENLNEMQAAELYTFVEEHSTKWHGLSLRLMKHASQIYKLGGDWKDTLITMKAKQ